MNRHDFPNLILLCLAAIPPLIFNLPPISGGQDDLYTKCGALFNCGKLTAVGYPFWGGDRPKECGDPRLQLVCENARTTIQMNKVMYHALDVNWEKDVFKIARIDLSQTLCPQEYTNTTLDYEIFEYAAGYLNLTLLYGCPAVDFSGPFRFDCAVKGKAERNGYVEVGTKLLILGVCYSSVIVPVPVSYAAFLKFKDLREVIRQGFEVRLKVDGGACPECENSGGKCGYVCTMLRGSGLFAFAGIGRRPSQKAAADRRQ